MKKPDLPLTIPSPPLHKTHQYHPFLSPTFSFSSAMRLKYLATLLSFCAAAVLLTTFSLQSSQTLHFPPSTFKNPFTLHPHANLIQETNPFHRQLRVSDHPITSLVSILLPDWEVLLLSSHSHSHVAAPFTCLFQNNATSEAKFTGILKTSYNQATFKCAVPPSVRRLSPLLQPTLTDSVDNTFQDSPPILRWNFLAYESLSTEDDVILFAKGVNNRQGVNRPTEELSCVFDNGVNYSVKTTVTSSSQEVFRCLHPNATEFSNLFSGSVRIKTSLEMKGNNKEMITVPSVTYYAPQRRLDDGDGGEKEKSLICVCTMVHNVGKFLKEWVVYYSKLGVDKFLLYDNDSDDDLEKVVRELVDQDYNVKTFSWPWPKTQEAGFSHSAIYARDSCKWMMYVDVDEFVFAPSWVNASYPTNDMLVSLLPSPSSSLSSPPSVNDNFDQEKLEWLKRPVGQVSVRCYEFGPSNQLSHPIAGVTQGYTCRRRREQRHKSIVLLEVIDASLHNVIHHFQLKEPYRARTLTLKEGVVNHYKYQAWSEFKTKFRRRVSAYVVDWRQGVNPMSNDRTPGLGFEAIEPEGWATKFCEVRDTRLKVVTQRWFGSDTCKMVWQD